MLMLWLVFLTSGSMVVASSLVLLRYRGGIPHYNQRGELVPAWPWVVFILVGVLVAFSAGLSLFTHNPHWFVDKIYGSIHFVIEKLSGA